MASFYKKQVAIFIFILTTIIGCVPTATPKALLPTSVTSTPTALPAIPTYLTLTAVPPTETLIPDRTNIMKLKVTLEDTTVITATLIDSKTTQDFISLLPLTLTLDDYSSTEKISYLPRKLSTEGAPSGVDPSIGDITYYAPWGNLAIFYKDFGYASGLILLGKIDNNGIEALSVSGSVQATIELISEP